EASPLSYVSARANATAFLIVWGTDDDVVDPKEQSGAFLEALKQAGHYVRPVVLPGAPHFWIGDPLDEPGSQSAFLAPRLLRFLQARLCARRSPRRGRRPDETHDLADHLRVAQYPPVAQAFGEQEARLRPGAGDGLAFAPRYVAVLAIVHDEPGHAGARRHRARGETRPR